MADIFYQMYDLNELNELDKICTEFKDLVTVEDYGIISDRGYDYPLRVITIGSNDPNAPVLGLFGGVHGLERIGTQVILSLLRSYLETLRWDEFRKDELKKIRLVFFPLINPTGMARLRRSNYNGVDLMRNSPVEADNPKWMLGGQNYSNRLPWYRGAGKIEEENLAIQKVFQKYFYESQFKLTLDFHSGFGFEDRIWYPWAKSKSEFPNTAEVKKFENLIKSTYPYLWYKIEPQSDAYSTHGDVWDWLYEDNLLNGTKKSVYLPLTLEMGSWLWVRKSPSQLLSKDGFFNPLKKHRHKRILRRHQTLFDFLIRAVSSNKNWI